MLQNCDSDETFCSELEEKLTIYPGKSKTTISQNDYKNCSDNQAFVDSDKTPFNGFYSPPKNSKRISKPTKLFDSELEFPIRKTVKRLRRQCQQRKDISEDITKLLAKNVVAHRVTRTLISELQVLGSPGKIHKSQISNTNIPSPKSYDDLHCKLNFEPNESDALVATADEQINLSIANETFESFMLEHTGASGNDDCENEEQTVNMSDQSFVFDIGTNAISNEGCAVEFSCVSNNVDKFETKSSVEVSESQITEKAIAVIERNTPATKVTNELSTFLTQQSQSYAGSVQKTNTVRKTKKSKKHSSNDPSQTTIPNFYFNDEQSAAKSSELKTSSEKATENNTNVKYGNKSKGKLFNAEVTNTELQQNLCEAVTMMESLKTELLLQLEAKRNDILQERAARLSVALVCENENNNLSKPSGSKCYDNSQSGQTSGVFQLTEEERLRSMAFLNETAAYYEKKLKKDKQTIIFK